ncbi:transferase [Xylariaceae sp. FL1651]|nr:transferase [Xylariaceae sp. FL1651]
MTPMTTILQVRSKGWQDDPEQETWTLGDLEYAMPSGVLRIMLLYRLSELVDHDIIIDQLRGGLEMTLDQCRTLTGVFKKQEGEVHIIRRRGNAIPFIIKHSDDKHASYETLEAVGFPTTEVSKLAALEDMGNTLLTNTVESGRPLFELQVTWISGGMILTVGYHHYLMDGVGFTAFLKQWTANTLALNVNVNAAVPAWDSSCFDRGRMNGTFVPPDRRITLPKSVPEMKLKIPLPPVSRPVVLQFHKKDMKRLRMAATPQETSVSSYDAVAALVWRVHTRARLTIYDNASTDATTHLSVVNIRARFEPPLPQTLQANACFMVVTKPIPVFEVVAEGALFKLATMIQQSHTDGPSNDIKLMVQKKADMTAALKDKTMASLPVRDVPRFAVAMSDRRYSGFYEADFGFGAPASIRHDHQTGMPSIMRRIPPRSDKHGVYNPDPILEVQVAVELPCLEKFLGDSELHQYAKIFSV